MSKTHSSDEETDFQALSKTNYQRVQDKVAKISYPDGVIAGREQSFQSSFDRGYADGLKTGLELAKRLGFFDTLPTLDAQNEELLKETHVYQGLQIASPTDKTHFKYLEYQSLPPNLISEKQNSYINNLLGQYAGTLPITENLFTSK
ncbi:uncharacterized protein LOC115620923 [Scaptodrosophila lebanonensis]|uniref:Uncharacterized protein LOC115620923 n=1 Tax=Drosophila lebanonensis TaxID=7225 RepID=A0A6J2T4S5_DROLE|nr:uncharacterized protein LOC115620923 [Scaptodrosophila lebanonensis]